MSTGASVALGENGGPDSMRRTMLFVSEARGARRARSTMARHGQGSGTRRADVTPRLRSSRLLGTQYGGMFQMLQY